MIKIAVLGYGTVGSGVVEVINTNNAVINERIGEALEIKYVLKSNIGEKQENIIYYILLALFIIVTWKHYYPTYSDIYS